MAKLTLRDEVLIGEALRWAFSELLPPRIEELMTGVDLEGFVDDGTEFVRKLDLQINGDA
jgi:hypothetical protein